MIDERRYFWTIATYAKAEVKEFPPLLLLNLRRSTFNEAIAVERPKRMLAQHRDQSWQHGSLECMQQAGVRRSVSAPEWSHLTCFDTAIYGWWITEHIDTMLKSREESVVMLGSSSEDAHLC
jgi:hypothetical protein